MLCLMGHKPRNEIDQNCEVTAQEDEDLQAALFDDRDNNILSRRRTMDAEYQTKMTGMPCHVSYNTLVLL